jgi:hypothetical protein
MLRAVRFTLKLALFAVVVLVLGNWIHWKGHSVSDQVRIQMSHAERAPIVDNVRDWAKHATQDASDVTKNVARNVKDDLKRKSAVWKWKTAVPSPELSARRSADDEESQAEGEDIPATERQKLKALTRELSGSRGHD